MARFLNIVDYNSFVTNIQSIETAKHNILPSQEI